MYLVLGTRRMTCATKSPSARSSYLVIMHSVSSQDCVIINMYVTVNASHQASFMSTFKARGSLTKYVLRSASQDEYKFAG